MRIVMPMGTVVLAAGLALAAGNALAANAVQKECNTKYQAAKAANALNGLTYNQYYSKCAAEVRDAKPDAAATTTAPAPAPAPAPTPTAAPAPKPAPAPKQTAAPAPGGTVFPTAVSPQFSKETAGKQRFKTCLAQYNANKEKNANGGLKWIEKGGGYYSECNKRLKG